MDFTKHTHVLRTAPGKWHFRVSLIAFVAWIVLLSNLTISVATTPVLALMAIIWCGFILTLTPAKWRDRATSTYAVLLLFYSLSILGLQQLPQWADTPPDSTTYDLHGQAIDRHLRGETLPAEEFRLQLNANRKEWSPETPLSFAYILGHSDYFYDAYIGFFYHFTNQDPKGVILSHATMLAGLPLLVFLLAIRLFNDVTVASLASSLVILDTNFSVNAAWMLKDTWTTLLIVITLLASISLLDGKEAGKTGWLGTILTLSLTAMACLRPHVAVVFWVLLGIFAGSRLYHGNGKAFALLMTTLVSFYASGLMKLPVIKFDSTATYVNAVTSNATALMGSVNVVLQSSKTSNGAALDSAVSSFYKNLDDAPLITLAKSVSRTLFAPYPWVALSHGFRGNATELYWPGTALWILGLPFLSIGLYGFVRQSSLEQLLPLFAAISICFIYLVSLGEFSTRQRQFLVPLFWIWTAYGITLTGAAIRRKRIHSG